LSPDERDLVASIPERGGEHVDDGQLLRWIDGDLPAADARAVMGHLADCAACRDLANALRASRGGPGDEAAYAALAHRTRAPRLRRRISAGFAVAAAAAIVLFALPEPDALETYRLDGPHGGLAETRADAPGTDRFDEGSTLRLIARPKAPVEGVDCRGTIEATGGARRPVEARHLTRAPNGVCRLEAPAAELFPAPGAFTIYLHLEHPRASRTLSAPVRYTPGDPQ